MDFNDLILSQYISKETIDLNVFKISSEFLCITRCVLFNHYLELQKEPLKPNCILNVFFKTLLALFTFNLVI